MVFIELHTNVEITRSITFVGFEEKEMTCIQLLGNSVSYVRETPKEIFRIIQENWRND